MAVSDDAMSDEWSFWHRGSVRRIITGFTALLLVIVLGTLGYVALGWSPFDGLFMVWITVSGVGFGEVRPMGTALERIHTMLVIAFGLVAVAYTMAGLLQFVTEGEVQRLFGHQRVHRQIEMLRDHVVIAGFGRMGSLVCDELTAADLPFVVIELAADRLAEIERRGFLHVHGDATEEKILQEAGLLRAKALVTVVPSDADNVFITLTAREMNPHVTIVARAEHPSTQKKLHQAGANHVVLPAAVGARRIAALLTSPTAVEFIELVTQRSSLAIEMDEFPIATATGLAGLTLRDANIGHRTGVIVIAIKRRDGHVEFPPTGDQPFTEGDSIVVVGRRANLTQFRQLFCPSSKGSSPSPGPD
jgi:voltage-gated potassium channel